MSPVQILGFGSSTRAHARVQEKSDGGAADAHENRRIYTRRELGAVQGLHDLARAATTTVAVSSVSI